MYGCRTSRQWLVNALIGLKQQPGPGAHPIWPRLALQQAPFQGVRLDSQCIALHLQLLNGCLQILHAPLRLAVLHLQAMSDCTMSMQSVECNHAASRSPTSAQLAITKYPHLLSLPETRLRPPVLFLLLGALGKGRGVYTKQLR
jgi:hypothetical protein